MKTVKQLLTKSAKSGEEIFQAHQGDVQITSISEIPSGVKQIEKTFIAKSEKSGHAHALCGDYELYEAETGHVIVVGTDGCTLNHTGYQNLTPEYWNTNKALPIADHKPTLLKQGIYFIGIQKRKKHFSKIFGKVID